MDAFEEIAAQLLEEENYWVKKSVKIDLTPKDKVALQNDNMPRPEIDIVAFDFKKNECLLIEVKSYLDSSGVDFKDINQNYTSPRGSGRYKLLTCSNYRRKIEYRLTRSTNIKDKNGKIIRNIESWVKRGLIKNDITFRYGLIAGNVKKGHSDKIRKLFNKKRWLFWDANDIAKRIANLSNKGYENNRVTMVAKLYKKKFDLI